MVKSRTPCRCVPVSTRVNQLTIARTYAAAPSRPTPPVRDDQYTGPARMACGIASTGRNADVRRLRAATRGSMESKTGYGMTSLRWCVRTSWAASPCGGQVTRPRPQIVGPQQHGQHSLPEHQLQETDGEQPSAHPDEPADAVLLDSDFLHGGPHS